jgi:hypothetical protein
MEDNPMKIAKCFVVLCLCLFMGSCPVDYGEFEIDIGDYENQLAAWNAQNMLNYQISVENWSGDQPEGALITVKNGIPESSDPLNWNVHKRKSTIPEFYALIKSDEKIFNDSHNSGDVKAMGLKVSYNTEYHYPKEIISKYNGYTTAAGGRRS